MGIGEPAAAARLKELTAEGLLERVPYREPGQRQCYEYQLTPKGQALLPVLVALRNWGDDWAADEQEPILRSSGPTGMRLWLCSGVLALLAALLISSCSPVPAPVPVPAQFPRDLVYRPADRTLHLQWCGGTLTAQEKATQIVVTYTETYLGPGEASCKVWDLSVALREPLGSRQVVDGPTGDPIVVVNVATDPITAPEPSTTR